MSEFYHERHPFDVENDALFSKGKVTVAAFLAVVCCTPLFLFKEPVERVSRPNNPTVREYRDHRSGAQVLKYLVATSEGIDQYLYAVEVRGLRIEDPNLTIQFSDRLVHDYNPGTMTKTVPRGSQLAQDYYEDLIQVQKKWAHQKWWERFWK